MRWVFNLAHLLTVLFVFVNCGQDPYENQPRIIVEEGNLVFQSGMNHNVTFRSQGSGRIGVNNVDLEHLVRTAQSTITDLQQFKTIDATAFSNQLEDLKTQFQTLNDIATGFRELQDRVVNHTRLLRNIMGGNRRTGLYNLRSLKIKVDQLNRKMVTLNEQLNRNECESNPCQNGGTCVDSYNGFNCQCPSNWQGTLCDEDVNECFMYRNTGLGCQNGGTCQNTAGSFQCQCTPAWHGVLCNVNHDDCSDPYMDNRGLCANGVCRRVNRIRQGDARYDCDCNPGWTKNNLTKACDVDIDECRPDGRPHCSTNPPVQCYNTPGGFHCGPCPHGYHGNGQGCSDVNECETNNGGCSLSPRVSCYNTVGSVGCGPCPPGFVGDGRTCFPGVCSRRNGDCHPMATCIENNAVYAGYRECRCPSGYTGDGIGSNGCVPYHGGGGGGGGGGDGPIQPTACDSNPCVHGSCRPHSNTFSCICYSGYSGVLCDQSADFCASAPCKNGGTCSSTQSGYSCVCQETWQGPTCEREVQSCGGRIQAESGYLRYPITAGEQYPHATDCPWVIYTVPGKVLNVSNTFFGIESSHNCRFDFLQINDGDDVSAPVINRFCGQYERGQLSIQSTHNFLYLWFHSDSSVTNDGFELVWNTTDPVCGGSISGTHGTVTSPGFPGRYPHSRNCYWDIRVDPGKKILLQFSHLSIEIHSNCSFDFVRVYDGVTEGSPVLETYCNTTTPQPLTTSSSNALIHFHSDDSLSDTGFSLVFAAVPGIPGCGGLLTNDRGVLVSPNYPDRYLNFMNCEWLIRIHPDETIQLVFEEIHLEYHSRCRYDYIEVFDGKDATAASLGIYCGTHNPPPILSSSNTLFIKFVTDISNSGRGFKAQYQTTCGGVYRANTGIIKSPYYPNNYPSSRRCTYHVVLPVGQLVHLAFMDFDIEGDEDCQYDCLEAFDNGSPNATSLAHLCGTNIPEPITSTYNELLVIFRTDASVSNRGFLANFSGIDIGCGGVLTDRNGYFSTPSHPYSYPSGVKCNWLIRAPEGFAIQLDFNSFVLELHTNCSYDYVDILDSDFHSLGRYCGSDKPPPITSFGRDLYVNFVADESVSHEGFTASYLALDKTRSCGGTYRREYGDIKSPGYPNRYPHNRDCIWLLTVPQGKQIRLNTTIFDLESHSSCRYDSVEVRNGGEASSPLVGKFCGTRIINPIISHHNQVYIRFRSDSSSSHPGFSFAYDSASTGCGGELRTPSGAIHSPNYPQPYGHSAECLWTIRVSRGSKISLTLVDIDVEANSECNFDYLRIFDGASEKATPLTSKLCTSRQNPGTFTSSSNVVYVVFRTDVSVSGTGFNLAYHANCNTVLRGIRGVIESPNFPDMYPHNYNCTWEIQGLTGNNVSLAFSTLILENETNCEYDRIEILQQGIPIRAGRPPAMQIVANYCGTPTTLPRPFLINSSKVFVRFISDESTSMDGFRLEYAVQGCVGDFRKNVGTITSPNYPHGYPPRMDCVWTINTPLGTSVRLVLEDYDLEGSQNCMFDALTIYDGLDENSNKLHEFCHTISQSVTTSSSGNKMMLRFRSDYSINGKGFRARYSTQRDCYKTYRQVNQGTILSTNYPNNYPNGTQCSYIIYGLRDQLLELDFVDFDLPADPGCTQNYIEVFEGNYYRRNQKSLFKHCGTGLPDNYTQIISSDNVFKIKMFTSGNVTGKGFKANFKTVCGARIQVGSFGVLKSPNYPHGSFDRHNCSWTLFAEEGEHVTLTFQDMAIHNSENCSTAYVDVRDGSNQDAPLIGRYCGHHAPSPIMSRGHNLHVLLHNFGIFKAAYTKSTSVCGAELTAAEGTFNSPSYPDSYPPSSSCEWTIRSAPGNAIILSFILFSMEENDNCNTDYLEIHEEGPSGRSLGRYCGNDTPTNISAANVLWLKFRSDDSGSATGFQATYVISHGMDLTGNWGTVGSPTYPLKNFIAGVFTWTITVDPSLYVSIEFVDFEIDSGAREFCSTFLQILDGIGDTSRSLGQLCGLRNPDPIVATSNAITLIFSTDGYYRGRWLLNWRGVNSTFLPTDLPPTYAPGLSCGEEKYLNRSDNFTVVTSPGFPNGYTSDLNCSWIFLTEPGRHVALKMNVSIEGAYRGYSCYDEITTYDALTPGSQWENSQEICGLYPALNVSSGYPTGTSVRKVKFVSSKWYRSPFYYGFSIAAYDECGSTLSGPRGIIQSEDGLRRNGTEPCQWLIRVRPGRTIQIRFEDFNIPSDLASCSTRYLQLRNGGYPDSPNLGDGKFCGDQIPVVPESSNNKVHVTLKSISTREVSPVFKLRYEELSLECGGRVLLTHTDHTTTLSSPNYPSDPPHDVECEWIITSPAGTTLRMDVEHLFTETGKCDSYDMESLTSTTFLEAYDGGTQNSHKLHRYCRHELQESVYTTNNVMLLRFVSGADVAHAHFSANITIGRCGGRLVRARNIQSPDYPQNYRKGDKCNWTISSTGDAYGIQGTFLDLDLPYSEDCSSTDHVEVRGKSSTGPLIGRFCGTLNSSQVTTFEATYSTIFVKFHADGNVTKRGFNLIFSYVRLCFNFIQTPFGTFSSPDYPQAYPHTRMCQWSFRMSPGRRIRLTFTHFNLPQDPVTGHCLQHLEITNGALYQNVTRVELCGTSMAPIESSSSTLNMKLTLTGLSYGEGFQGTYSSDLEPLCDGLTIRGNEGFVASPFQEPRSAYPSETNCKIDISTENEEHTNETYTFAFRVLDLDVGNDTNCNRTNLGFHPQNYAFYKGVCSFPEREILVPGRLVSVRSHTRDFGEIRFNISYKVHVCGGFMTAPVTLTSPNYPSNYPNDTRCIWIINGNYGERLEVSFNEQPRIGGSCENANLTIRNGQHINSPILSQFCLSKSAGLNVTSSRHVVLVIFTSDGSSSAAGFNLSVRAKTRGCGGMFNHIRDSFRSTNYPNPYPNNTQCEYLITLNPSYRVNISFDGRFDIEQTANCTKDYLLIEEKVVDVSHNDKTWKPLKRLCGHALPPPVLSETNEVRVTFTSDAAIQGDGFSFSYSGACGGLYSNSEGVITSPGFPDNYENSLNCHYYLHRTKNDYVTLQFDATLFDIERHENCEFDSVSVYMGNSTTATPLAVYCGADQEDLSKVFNVVGSLLLVFKTDDSVVGRGFSVTYKITSCGGNLTEAEGIIESPFYPIKYPNHLQCFWTITVTNSRIVELQIVDLVTESCCDILDIIDGNSSTIIKSFNGTAANQIVRSSGNQMVVSFFTDYSHRMAGFRAIYRTTFGQQHGCGGNIRDSSGQFSSLDFDKNGLYEDGLECIWKIVGDDNKMLRITFDNFDVEEVAGYDNETVRCGRDFLEIRDGLSNVSPLVGRYCGSTVPPQMTVSSNQLWVHFHSDFSQSAGRGFRASYESIAPICGGFLNVTDEPQTLTSPNYPSPYPLNLRCQWQFLFDTTRSDTMIVQINHFNIPCNEAYIDVHILDPSLNNYDRGTVHLRFCGDHYLRENYASQSFVMTFHTNSGGSSGGFSLTYNNANCSRHYTEDNAIIYSPTGGSNDNIANVECLITITAKPGRTISINFIRLTLRNERRRMNLNCQESSLRLQIRDGLNESAPMLKDLCQSFGRPPPVYTSGENAWIHFKKTLMSDTAVYSIVYTTTDQGPGCGGTLNGPVGIFSSPFYPSHTNRTQACLWKISLKSQNKLILSFLNFRLTSVQGCDTNYVEIYQGSSETEAGRVGRFCGWNHPAAVTSLTNELLVKLVTNENNTDVGFQAIYSTNTYETSEPSNIHTNSQVPTPMPPNS